LPFFSEAEVSILTNLILYFSKMGLNFQLLLDEWERYYYAMPFNMLVEIVALTMGFKHVSNQRLGRYFLVYIAFDLFVGICSSYLTIYNYGGTKFDIYFIYTSNLVIAVVELLIYYHYFKIILKRNGVKIVLNSLQIIFLLLFMGYLVIVFFFSFKRFTFLSSLLGALEFCFILYPCIIYYLSMFKTYNEYPLLKRPTFWIVTGVFFFSLTSIPFYITNNYISIYHKNYHHILAAALYYLPFTINFIFLTKAFLCKKPLTI
jgi:hypothetical protein